jgi:hypothetical protein
VSQVGQNLSSLGFESALGERSGRRIESSLAGAVEQAADRDRLGIGTDRRRRLVGVVGEDGFVMSRRPADMRISGNQSASWMPTKGRLR